MNLGVNYTAERRITNGQKQRARSTVQQPKQAMAACLSGPVVLPKPTISYYAFQVEGKTMVDHFAPHPS